MRILQCLICAMLLSFATDLYGDEAEELRQLLPTLSGRQKLDALARLHDLSRESNDPQEELNCLYDHLNEARRQGDIKEQCGDLVSRDVLFYNYDLNDSLYHYVRDDMKFLARHDQWEQFYRLWYFLANTYVYSDSLTTGLKEAQSMYDDARERQDVRGQGLSYMAMGNAYFNMNNMEEAMGAYQKAIEHLMTVTPLPTEVPSLFSSQCDVLERLQDYEQLDRLTIQWKKGIEQLARDWKVSASYSGFLMNWVYYYIGCAQAALGLGRLDQADKMLAEAKKSILSEEEETYRSWLFYRARLAMKRGDIADALSYNTQLLPLVEDVDDKAEIIRVKQQRAEIMTSLGRDKAAAELYREMYLITDSANVRDTKKQLAEMNARFNVDELEMKQARLKMEQAQQQRLGIIIIASIVVLSLVIFIYFRLRSAKRLKKAHEELEEAHSNLLTAYDQLEETTAAKERIESDLRIARNIQMSMVPSNFPDREDLDIFALIQPAKEVGGDLYGYLLLDDQLYFCLGDVSGKGVPASLFMAQATRLFRTLAAQMMKPAEIATRINDALSGEDNETGMFVTMFIGLADLKTGHLHFCNAGHNPPVLVSDGKTEFIEMVPNAPIGLWPGLEYEGEEIETILNKPLFIYSDGLNEAENRQQEQFSDERLLELLETTPFENCRQTIEMMHTAVEAHRDGADPNDDLTMLCVKIIGNN